jgi:hypothetical protein
MLDKNAMHHLAEILGKYLMLQSGLFLLELLVGGFIT